LIDEPPPAWAFELSPGGIAFAMRTGKKAQAPEIRFSPFEDEVLAVSPVKDNVLRPDILDQQVAALAPSDGHQRRKRDAALILPDYCARIAVLDFQSFPSDRAEQHSLVRFRMKKTVPFEMDSAALSYHARSSGKGWEVVVAAAPMEVIARYEAPFRAAGFQPGFATTSLLAALDLMPAEGLNVAVKSCGRVLTVAICEARNPKLVRCVELDSLTMEEVMSVLFPTLAYAEDELPRKVDRIFACGFGASIEDLRARCESELGLPVEPLRSLWGAPTEANAGLHGWLQAQEGRA
jgi:type IV pilus assembly protein PilM